ncbi:hypothetical protein G647_08017 [Cladophialophora carrionii CBS 160.54]|uniref:Uncharacterized protein n=1 Tax=Cladophialophora carrionii CBS 160.54 TaxID=1279043 RepID=V9D471_9EURO|nr:uncharacterized protein G647_08017 [Cladophialophora carrionii CBS 160.54]ETI21670.1 hypothetical protein G647_08017 [Cladophialophora carrionii CBS 160.54]
MVLEQYKFRERKQQFKLSELLATFGQSKCADIRDRVFVLLGLCEEGVKGVVQVDYYVDIPSLFWRTVSSCFAESIADAEMLATVLEHGDSWFPSDSPGSTINFSICRFGNPHVNLEWTQSACKGLTDIPRGEHLLFLAGSAQCPPDFVNFARYLYTRLSQQHIRPPADQLRKTKAAGQEGGTHCLFRPAAFKKYGFSPPTTRGPSRLLLQTLPEGAML